MTWLTAAGLFPVWYDPEFLFCLASIIGMFIYTVASEVKRQKRKWGRP